MKTKLLLLCIAVCSYATLHAQSSNGSLVVEFKDGTSSAFLLSEKPKMTFSGNDLVFKSEQAEIIVARDNFNYFHFTGIAEGVELPFGSTNAEFVAPGVLRIQGVNANAVSVYTFDGGLCPADKSAEGDAVTVSLRSLPQGVYVVRYGATAVKMSNN